MIRNLFTVFGIVSIFAVFFFFIKPDWVKQIYSSPGAQGPTTQIKILAKLPGDRLAAKDTLRDKNSFLRIENGDDGGKIVEDVGDDVPARSAPYLLVINKATNTLRYCRMSTQVKKVSLRNGSPQEVKLQEITSNSNMPYQAIIWVPSAIDLYLEFELAIPSPSRS
jgi:hypothetical protein